MRWLFFLKFALVRDQIFDRVGALLRNKQAPLARSASWTSRSRHILSWPAWGTYHPGTDIADKIYEVLNFLFRNLFWFDMIESMTSEHCFTKTLAVYVCYARLVLHPFPNWLLVLSEHRSFHPSARRRQRCRTTLVATSYWFCTQRDWCGSFESVVISMDDARKCNTCTQLVMSHSFYTTSAFCASLDVENERWEMVFLVY